MRRVFVPVLLALTGVLLLVGGLGLWVDSTVYDSRAFSRRAVSMLDSEAVRKAAADLLTTELVKVGNQQAISYRPAFQAAIEAALDTDTFRSIIRNGIRTVHADVLRGGGGSSGINLSDSISIISGNLQLPSNARGQPVQEGGFSSSFADITEDLASYGVWRLESTIRAIGFGCLAGAVVAAVLAIVLSRDHRRTVWWLGWVLAIVGVFVLALLWAAQWYAGRLVAGAELSSAVSGGISDITVDLRTLALWVVGYGIVVAGAAASTDQLYTPAVVGRRTARWLEARRQTTWGTLLVGVLGVVLGFVIIQNLAVASVVLAVVAGLWLTYLGTAELLRLLRRVTTDERTRSSWWRPPLVFASVLLLLAALTAGLVVTTSRSAADASDSAPSGCNGDEALCERRLNEVVFAGTHNSMSSALYPGWLFGEQIGPIGDQLNSGIRALLIDTHYGIPSRARLPGSQTPIVLTDRARELSNPEFEGADPGVVERANTLSARAPQAANAESSIYLCHNYCELGAISFASVLADVKKFVETHPDDVVLIVVQDATTPDDTAQAFIDAGLEDEIATLQLGQPLPTLQELIDAGTTLVVFAEEGGGDSGPPWYQPAYEGWFEETLFSYDSIASFDCTANRGGTSGQLFLINHWVTTRGPNPGLAAQANKDDVVGDRARRCAEERGQLPNIIAADYVQASALVDFVALLNTTLLDEVPGDSETQVTTPPSTTTPSPTTTTASLTTTTVAGDAPADIDDATVITSLTGGDPGRFCATVTDTVAAVTAYAEAALSEATSHAGVSDLAFAPLLLRALTPYLEAAPNELFELADPLRQRATAAEGALEELGLDARDRAALADEAELALSGAPPTDGATLQAQLLATIAKTAAQEDIDAAATRLFETNGDPAPVLDLGFVSEEVAAENGFTC